MQLYFESFIGKMEAAELFFKLLDEYGLLPEKIGLYEPIRDHYSLNLALEYWTKIEKGNGREVGGMMGKRKKPEFSFLMEWNRGEKYIRPNFIFISIPKNAFKRDKETYLYLFKTLLQSLNRVYGYISIETVENRQFVPGTLETRLPGMFWVNYFGQVYVDFFGKEKFNSGPWYHTEELNNDSLVVMLSKDPDELEQDESNEKKAKLHLGIDSFGNREHYLSNIFETQIKNVPKLELKELRYKKE
jgi:hypothetical protein